MRKVLFLEMRKVLVLATIINLSVFTINTLTEAGIVHEKINSYKLERKRLPFRHKI